MNGTPLLYLFVQLHSPKFVQIVTKIPYLCQYKVDVINSLHKYIKNKSFLSFTFVLQLSLQNLLAISLLFV